MNNKPKHSLYPEISVVMSVYNGERYLKKAIDSILNQTYSDFEFIIINDGSTDRTLQILQKAGKRDKRIRLISRENRGLTVSLNEGIKSAKGKYIARMDGDDISRLNRFEVQTRFLKQNPGYVAVGSEVMKIDPEGWPLGIRGHYRDHDDIDRMLLKAHGGAMTHPSVMIRRDAIIDIGYYSDKYLTAQDLDLFLRLAEHGKLYNLPNILLYWRQHPNSVNHTRHQTWKEMWSGILSETMERRKINIDLERILARGSFYKEDLRYDWALKAYRAGYPFTAIKNFMLSIAHFGLTNYHLKKFQKIPVKIKERYIRA